MKINFLNVEKIVFIDICEYYVALL